MRFFWIFLVLVVFFVATAMMPEKKTQKQYGLIGHFVSSEGVVESSGLLSSRKHKGVFWTLNDSGNKPELFAFTLDGKIKRSFEVKGARCIDWEALAQDEQGHLFIADVGDNFNLRPSPKLYRIDEPSDLKKTQVVHVDKVIEVDYVDDTRYNTEALCTTPEGQLLLITRSPKEAVYGLKEGRWEPLQKLKTKGPITGADINKKGELAVLTYKGIALYRRNKAGKWKEKKFLEMELRQCEGICWEDDSDLIVTNEEGEIYRVNPLNLQTP